MTVRCLPVHDMPNPDRDGRHTAVKTIQGRGEAIPLEIAPPGHPIEGSTDRDSVVEMLVGYSAPVRCRIRKGVLEPVRRGDRSLQRFHVGMVCERGSDANTEVLAEILEVTPRTIQNYRTELSRKASRGNSTHSAPVVELDVEFRDGRWRLVVRVSDGFKEKLPKDHMDMIRPILTKLDAINADTAITRADAAITREAVLEVREILRANFPGETFGAAVDRFIADARRNAD